MSGILADFESHHIEGYAAAAIEAGRDGRFAAPLISHIEGNLYMGGCIGGVSLGDEFRYVVSLYPWQKYLIGDNTSRVEVGMLDAAEMPADSLLDDLAGKVSAMLDRGKTLVHCQAGLNRSGLVSALTLIRRGRSAAEAIALLRDKRHPVVLCNATFEAWLLAHDEATP